MIAPDLTRLSPNVNNAPIQGRTVIIHGTRSGVSLNPTEFQGTLNHMARPGTTSSHWVISRTGVKARVVLDTKQAWHAQEDNDNCWGIELEQGAEQDGFTDPQIAALVEVCRGYMQDFGVPASRATTSGGPGFIGHQDTAQGRRNGKSDPGAFFPWAWFLAALQLQEDGMTTEQAQELGEQRARAYLFDALLRDFRVAPVEEDAKTLTVELRPVDGQPAMARLRIFKRPEVVRGE